MTSLKNHLRRPLAAAISAVPLALCAPAYAGSIVSFQFESVICDPFSEGCFPLSSSNTFPSNPRGDFAYPIEGGEGGEGAYHGAGAAAGFGVVNPNEAGDNTTTYGAGAIAMDDLQVRTRTTATVAITNDTGVDGANLNYLFEIFAGGLGISVPNTLESGFILPGQEDADWAGPPGSQPICDVENISRCRDWIDIDEAEGGEGGEGLDLSTQDTRAEVNFSAVLNKGGSDSTLFDGTLKVFAEFDDELDGAVIDQAISIDSRTGNDISNDLVDTSGAEFFDGGFNNPSNTGPYDISWRDTIKTYALGAFDDGETAVLTLVAEAIASVSSSCNVDPSESGQFSIFDSLECPTAHAYWADPAGLGRRGGGISLFSAFALPVGPSLFTAPPRPIDGNFGPTDLNALNSNLDPVSNGQLTWTDDQGRPLPGIPLQFPNAAGIPAPSALWLIGLGGVLLLGHARRRKGPGN